MKKILLIPAIAAIMLFSVTCKNNPQPVNDKATEQVAAANGYYTCEMHPEIKSDVAGKCPKCGMDLVFAEVQADSDTTSQQNVDSPETK
jgi:Cu(I)/Ag(I) efflux system membrane fusion protein